MTTDKAPRRESRLRLELKHEGIRIKADVARLQNPSITVIREEPR